MGALEYKERLVDRRLQELFSELPAIMLTGPRATGKTTSASRIAESVANLGEPNTATAFRDNPDSALRVYPEPVLIDEWQLAPEVLGAVKRAVDAEPHPARFLLAGSARARLESPTWPGTGRVTEVHMEGLTEREISGAVTGPGFLDRLANANLDEFAANANTPDLVGYIDRALRGGFPETALRLSSAAAPAWLDGYLEQVVGRDAEQIDAPRNPEKLRSYFEAVCLNTAGTPTHKKLQDAAGVDHRTASAYDDLLMNLYIVKKVPAWATNRLRRLARAPKSFVVDAALVAAATRLDAASVVRDSDLTGRIIETFAVAQIRAEAALTSRGFRLHQLRERGGGHEIDLIAEGQGGSIVAIEIKASTTPKKADARHLTWLQGKLGDSFAAGAILHTGSHPYRLADRIFALPLYTLWS